MEVKILQVFGITVVGEIVQVVLRRYVVDQAKLQVVEEVIVDTVRVAEGIFTGKDVWKVT